MVEIIILPFIISIASVYFVIIISKKFDICTDKVDKKHAVHKESTPKCGGIGIFLSFAISTYLYCRLGFNIAIGSLPIFVYGLYEDSNGETPQKLRLLLMAISSLLVIYLLKAYVNDIGLFTLPRSIGVLFTIFCVVGISSAINFIDGLNGLATGVCLITIIFYGISCYILDDVVMVRLMIITFLSILGFFIFNYPLGKIFLGDGGAYFLGVLAAFLSILLVNRHGVISPWYPLNAFAYPIIETIVTIRRRYYKKKYKGIPFFQSEKVHLHTLLYKRKTRRNPLASFYLLSFHFIINLLAFLIRSNLPFLIILFILTWVVYLKWYNRMFIKS
jgi:UDP-GlcNAc:undecaprenyl-phosphate GlcNAc-1-phosphate transferase